jgi:NAD(P)-dependent dehydrogenase (short-subunit alcohol dehydrogenase family)
LVPLDLKDADGIARLALALNERYQRLDVMVGNAGIAGIASPLDHVELQTWNDMFAINVTANWQLIRTMDVLLKRSPAGRAVFMTSGAAHRARPYVGAYAASKAALEALARTYANETAPTNIKVNLFSPNPTRTRMRASLMPGEDPMTLPVPEEVAKAIVPLCLPACAVSGKLYDFKLGKFLDFHPPA